LKIALKKETFMCLAIPGKVIEIDSTVSPVMGKVSFGGIKKEVCLELVPEVKVGNYVVVHVGFAISMMDEEEAQETLKLLKQMRAMENDQQQDKKDVKPS
jgi:hydrogenase expression/formation protein HypC